MCGQRCMHHALERTAAVRISASPETVKDASRLLPARVVEEFDDSSYRPRYGSITRNCAGRWGDPGPCTRPCPSTFSDSPDFCCRKLATLLGRNVLECKLNVLSLQTNGGFWWNTCEGVCNGKANVDTENSGEFYFELSVLTFVVLNNMYQLEHSTWIWLPPEFHLSMT